MKYFYLIAILGFCIACQSSQKLKGKDLSSGWNYGDILEYQLNVPNNPSLVINHTPDYQYENLYLLIEQKLGSQDKIDTVSLQLADELGYWKGDCSTTNCKLSLEGLIEANSESIRLHQYSREKTLQHIRSIDIVY